MALDPKAQHSGARMFDSDGDPIDAAAFLYGDPMWEIARTGQYRGKTANIGWMFGKRDQGWDSTTLFGDVAQYLNTTQQRITPTVLGTPYYIVSTSASDGVGGTGIRSVRVNCLVGELGVRSIRTITLNGTTPVLLGDDVHFVQYMESEAIGSNGVAVGDIYCSSLATPGTPTVAQTIDKIVADTGRSRSGRVMVPHNFNLYLVGWHVSAIGANMDAALRGQAFTDNRAVSPGYHFQETAYVPNGTNFTDDFHYLPFQPHAILKLSAIPSSAPAGNRCEGSMHFILIEI